VEGERHVKVGGLIEVDEEKVVEGQRDW